MKARCCPQVSYFEGYMYVWPPSDILGGHLNFLRATYYHQWNTILYAFFYKSWICPYNMQGPSYIALKFRGSASSPVQIGRSLRKQGEVIDCCIQKTEKNSLWSDFSLIEIKKNTRKNSHWPDCYLLSILRNLVGKFEIHMILLSLYFIYLSTSLHLSEVSGIFDLLPTWAFPSENVT